MTTHPILNKPTLSTGTPFGFMQALWLGVKLFVTFLGMLAAFTISGALITVPVHSAPEEASQAGTALLIVSLVDSLVLSYIILRSRWFGLKLMAAVFVIHFGVQTFMSQIETLFFINAVKIPMEVLVGVIGTGLVRALIFAPIAVFVLGKFRGSTETDAPSRFVLSTRQWVTRFAILALVYVVVYFGFGYFVAMQWAEARNYYAGTFTPDLVLPLFQILRGVMWAALALLVVALMRGKKWETYLAIGLAFAVLIASSLIFPNPFMPFAVREAHFFELTSSMLTYGVIAGWVWLRGTKE